MIEPLRYHKETALTFEVERPVFCSNCLLSKQTRNNPGLAIIYCQQCPCEVGDVQEDGAFLCNICNDHTHKYGVNVDHVRQIIVVGPGVRKRVIVRGDGVSFPLPLDFVKVKMKASIYHNGIKVHTEKKQTVSFVAGMSGKCIHVQVLGARNLKGRDLTGTSDPFVVYSYCGKPVGSTRVKARTRNPRWVNETFVVPVEEHLAYPRDMMLSQKDMIKFEVMDYDWITRNDFLGQIELSRSKLMKMAVIANEQPIRLPLTSKECHGILSVQFAVDKVHLYVKVCAAEDLPKQDLFSYCSPTAKVFLGEKTLLGSTPVMSNTIHPQWISGNEFKVKLADLLEAEELLGAQLRLHRASAGMAASGRNRRVNEINEHFNEFSALPEFLALLRVELHDRRAWLGDLLLGTATIFAEQLRRVLGPELPTQNEFQLANENSMGAEARPLSRALFSRARRREHEQQGQAQGTEGSAADNSDIEAAVISTPNSRPASPNVPARRAALRVPSIRRNPSQLEDPSSSSHTPTPSSKRSLSFKLSKPVPLTWCALQRLPLVKFSMQSYVEKLGLGAAAESDGFLIVRLLISHRGRVVNGLDEAVRRMTVGEQALVKCRYDSMYGNYTLGPTLPPRANVVFNVRLVELNVRGWRAAAAALYGVPTRMIRRLGRLLRVALRLILQLLYYLCALGGGGKGDKDDGKGLAARATKRMTIMGISLGSAAYEAEDSDEDFDESGSEFGDDGDEDNHADHGQHQQATLPSAPSPSKADPFMRKHLTGSVRTGAKLLWTVGDGMDGAGSKKKKAAKGAGYGEDELTRQLRRIQQLNNEEKDLEEQVDRRQEMEMQDHDQPQQDNDEDEVVEEDAEDRLEGAGEEDDSDAS